MLFAAGASFRRLPRVVTKMNTQPQKTNRAKLRTAGASDYTGLAESTLEKLRVSGGGPLYIRVGRVVVYDPDDLDAWLETHKRRSTSDQG